ncbi:hypothetical protein VTK73DRAFT_6994 [Phialemonium thermophilum]|uniref:Uncharacterized protein n=1 Tax=Phialemonium thermophilum TaxID=223376 RepID=A0ABR3WH02_9PEZI
MSRAESKGSRLGGGNQQLSGLDEAPPHTVPDAAEEMDGGGQRAGNYVVCRMSQRGLYRKGSKDGNVTSIACWGDLFIWSCSLLCLPIHTYVRELFNAITQGVRMPRATERQMRDVDGVDVMTGLLTICDDIIGRECIADDWSRPGPDPRRLQIVVATTFLVAQVVTSLFSHILVRKGIEHRWGETGKKGGQEPA